MSSPFIIIDEVTTNFNNILNNMMLEINGKINELDEQMTSKVMEQTLCQNISQDSIDWVFQQNKYLGSALYNYCKIADKGMQSLFCSLNNFEDITNNDVAFQILLENETFIKIITSSKYVMEFCGNNENVISNFVNSSSTMNEIATSETAISILLNCEPFINSVHTSQIAIDALSSEYSRNAIKNLFSDEEILVKGFGYIVYNVGDVVNITHSGSLVQFRVAHKNYVTQNKIVLVSESAMGSSWYAGYNGAVYTNSSLIGYMNGTIFNEFEDSIKNAIVNTNVVSYGGNTNCKVWALSMTEIGLSGFATEGAKLDWFDNASKLSKGKVWWTRSRAGSGNYSGAYKINTSGGAEGNGLSSYYAVVPAFEI